MYGSSFCIRTRSPRRSSNRPIDAEVSPLPRLLTTPPVTKICLVVMRGPPGVLGNERNDTPEPHKRNTGGPAASCHPISAFSQRAGLSRDASPHAFHKASIVLGRVDANRALFDHRHLNTGPHFQYAKLL